MTKKGEAKTQKTTIWFPAKSHGWGWGVPKVWQGWVALLGCLGIGVAPLVYLSVWYKGDSYCQQLLDKNIDVSCSPTVATGMYVISSLLWLIGWVMILIVICQKKGEQPTWRWGDKKKNAAKPKTD